MAPAAGAEAGVSPARGLTTTPTMTTMMSTAATAVPAALGCPMGKGVTMAASYSPSCRLRGP